MGQRGWGGLRGRSLSPALTPHSPSPEGLRLRSGLIAGETSDFPTASGNGGKLMSIMGRIASRKKALAPGLDCTDS